MKYFIVASNSKERKVLLHNTLNAFDNESFIIDTDLEDDLFYELDTRKINVVLIDLDSKHFNLDNARTIYEMYSDTKVILISSDAKMSVPAFLTRAFGYLVKPNESDIKNELNDIFHSNKKRNIQIKTFGNFDIFVDGTPVKFERKKSKELLAYLVYRRGTGTSASELIVNLWEDKDVCRTTRSMIHNLISDIRKTLHEYNIEYIFSCERNCYRIIPEMVLCDYYEFIEDKTKTNFIGEFMSEYEWAIYVSPELSDILKSRLNK